MDTRTIYCGDNLEELSRLPNNSVDLIYADPPFFSNRHYEVIWNDGAEVRAFEDRWKGGIEHYVQWMRPRLQECHRILKPTGSMYLHCDWHANAHLRILMDSIFGASNFRNELIWCYKGGNASKKFRQKHDTIYFYSKTDKYVFFPDSTRIPYNQTLLGGTEVDEDGKRYYRTGQNKTGRVYLNPLGQLPYDWWDDIPSGSSSHGHEFIGYPTQKPEALLHRIIMASSQAGDIILDPFCGCGTSIAVAQQTGREWIGIDVSPTACRMMHRRLTKLGASCHLVGMPTTIPELEALDPFAFQDWVIDAIKGRHSPKKTGDMGIDGWTFGDNKPVQVKQIASLGRNAVDNFQTAIRRDHNDSGIIYAFGFSKSAHEEAARAQSDGINIQLVTVKQLIEGE